MFQTLLIGAAIAVAVQFAISLLLVFSQGDVRIASDGLDFDHLPKALAQEVEDHHYASRDGSRHRFRKFEAGRHDAPLLVLIHGSGWHGDGYLPLAQAIAYAGAADVMVPDLRGHGPQAQRRGDVDHIGQLEEDIADLISLRAREGQEVVLAGHSSGGGLVIRFAGGEYGSMIHRAILLAPFLKYNSPATRPNSGGWAAPFTRRIIGLTMLNAMGVRWFNHLPVIRFNFPQKVLEGSGGAGATLTYSYRLNTSYAPRSDYLRDIAALPPFLLIAGRDDEAFFADRYEEVMAKVNPKGRYVLLDGISHIGVSDPDASAAAMIGFLAMQAQSEIKD